MEMILLVRTRSQQLNLSKSNQEYSISSTSGTNTSALCGREALVLDGTQEMKRYVRLVSNNPTVMWLCGYVEQVPGLHFRDAAIGECNRRTAGDNHADMLDSAKLLANPGPHVFRPFPSRLIACPADGHSAERHGLEFAFLEVCYLVRVVELLEYYFIHICCAPNQRHVPYLPSPDSG